MKKKIILSLVLVAALTAVSVFYFSSEAESLRGKEKTNVILITVETLRYDHTNLGDYERNTTPFLESFPEDSLHFERAYTPSSWTTPSLASIFTGLYPSEHGTTDGWDRLPENKQTLQESLSESGYSTTGIAGFGFPREAFKHTFDEFKFLEEGRRNARSVTNNIIRTVEQDSNPFFIWAHYVDPHIVSQSPYDVSGMYTSENKTELDCKISIRKHRNYTEHCVDLYDERIRFTDMEIQRLMEYLEKEGLYDDSMIIITSDHGEAFGEHGPILHATTPFTETLHVPFFIKFPEQKHAGKTVSEPVGLRQIPSTVLRVLGKNKTFTQDDYIDIMKNNDRGYVFSEMVWPENNTRDVSLVMDNYQFINIEDSEDMFFNLSVESGKRENLYNKPVTGTYKEMIEIFKNQTDIKHVKIEEKRDIDQKLKELGYLN